MTLRERCQKIHQQMHRDAMLRQGSPIDTLMEFVIAERGRTADDRLEDSHPVCVYFRTEADREEFIAAIREAKPNLVTKRMP